MAAVFLAGAGQTPADGADARDGTSAPDGDAEPGGSGSAPDVDDELGDLRGEYGWPSWGEVTATAGLALRTRVGGTCAPPRARAVGDTIRLVAVLGLLYQATTVVLSRLSMVLTVAFGLWTPDRNLYRSVLASYTGGDWWLTATLVMSLAWVPAYAMLVAGRRRASLAWIPVALVSSITTPIRQLLEVEPMTWLTALAQQLPIWLAAICVVLGYHRAAPQLPPRAWPWARRAVPAAVLGLTSVWAFTIGIGLAGSIDVPPDAVAALLGGLAVLILHRRAPAPWPAAVATLTGATLGAHTLDLLGNLATDPFSSSYALPGLVAAGLGFTASLLTTALARPHGQHSSPAPSR